MMSNNIVYSPPSAKFRKFSKFFYRLSDKVLGLRYQSPPL
jgi:hypothetical protein